MSLNTKSDLHDRSKSSTWDTKPALFDHAEELIEYIDLDVLVPRLKRERLLTDDEAYTARNPYLPPGERIQTLLTFVSRKGQDGPNRFVECIASTASKTRGHAHLVNKVLGVRPEQEINADIDRHVSNIEENKREAIMIDKYAYLLTKASTQLQNVDMQEFRVYVSNLHSSEYHPDQSIARSDKEKIQGAATPDEIFHVLTNGGYWGYRKPFLLYLIVNRFGSVDLVNEVAKYREQLEPFESDPAYMPSESPPVALRFARNPVLSQKFGNTVINVQKEFARLDILESLKVFATLLPMEYGQMEQPHIDAIASAPDASSVFGTLGFYWDWQQYRPLKCIVETFGTAEAKRMMNEYDREFENQQQPSHYEAPAVETELFGYRTQFAQLVLKTLEYLKQSYITLKSFCQFLSRQPLTYYFQHHQILDPAAQTWSAIFLLLNHHWDHFNFKLLQEILETFKIEHIFEDFLQYQQNIHRFIGTTSLGDLVKALPSCHPLARAGFVKLSVSFDGTSTELKFVHFKQFQQSFTHEFDIPDYAVRIYTVKFRTIIIGDKEQYHYRLKCYVPSAVASHLIVASRAKGHFYEQYQITHLKFHEDKHYYFSCSILESGSSSILQQAKANPDVCKRLDELRADAGLSRFQRFWTYLFH